MQPDYIKIELKSNMEHAVLKRMLPDVLAYPLFYQPNRMQIFTDDMGDFQGIKVELPVAEEELTRIREAWVKSYFAYLEQRLKLQQVSFFVTEQLLQQFDMKKESYVAALKLLLLREMAETIMRKHGIIKKTARLTLIDDAAETWYLPYAIYQLAPGCNHMTVVTDREEALRPVLDDILQEYGLVIEIEKPQQMKKITGDLIINLCQEEEKYTDRIQGMCALLDFGYTDKKAVRLGQINPKIAVYHTIKLKSVQDTIALEELSQILYYKEPLFRRLVHGELDWKEMQGLKDIWDRYFVEMVRVY